MMLVTRKKYDALQRERDHLAASVEQYREAHALDGRTIAALRSDRDKFKWQVRDTCRRAEDAEARLRKLEPARDPVTKRFVAKPLPAGDMGEVRA